MRVKKSEGARGRRGHKSLKVAAERSSPKVVVSGLRSQCQGCTKESAKGPELQAEEATSIYLQAGICSGQTQAHSSWERE